MLYSVVDDRSGVAYQEYHCVYGEDAETALRFLFNAMSAKPNPEVFPLQGRPKLLYLDNGPVAKSRVFHNVMLGLELTGKPIFRPTRIKAKPQREPRVRLSDRSAQSRKRMKHFIISTSQQPKPRPMTG